MNKYKLINLNTKEEHLCDKTTIDGFNYYVSDIKITELKPDDRYATIVENRRRIVFYTKHIQSKDNVIIATNNLNIDIPKIINKIDLTKLCYYDRRNPDFFIKEEYDYDKEEVEATGNFAKKDCTCDNCFYGRSQLTEQLIKSQETHPFSEEDMIGFAEWIINQDWDETELNFPNNSKSTKELLQIWKEQRPKIIYYK